MSDNSNASGGGIGLASLLGVTFIVLKLTGVIAWDWIWVLAPFWISIGLGLLVLLVVGIVFLSIRASDKRYARKLKEKREADQLRARRIPVVGSTPEGQKDA